MAAPHEQKRGLFQSHFLLGKLEPGEIDTLATRSRVESYRAGQEIFAKGSPGRTMIAVLQGSVKIVSLSPTGKEIVLDLIHAGGVFGEISAIDGEERSAGAAAMTDCELLIIDRRDVLPMFERHPEIWMMLMQIVCRRLRRTGEQVENVLFRSRGLEARVAEQIEELGRVWRLKRFLPPPQHPPDIPPMDTIELIRMQETVTLLVWPGTHTVAVTQNHPSGDRQTRRVHHGFHRRPL